MAAPEVEIKDLLDENRRTLEELRGTVNTIDQAQKTGAPVGEIKTKLDKIEADMATRDQKLEKLEIDLKKDRMLLAATDAVVYGQKGRQLTPDQVAYKRAFFANLRAKGEDVTAEDVKALRDGFAKRLEGVSAPERKALVEDATGQILVPEDLETTIYTALPNLNTILSKVTTVPTVRDRVRRRSLTSVTVGWGKVEVGSPSNVDSFVSTPTPDDEMLIIENLYGLSEVGVDELEDSDVALEAFLVAQFGYALDAAVDDAIMAGRGHTTYKEPEGFTFSTLVTRVNAGQAGGVTFEDFMDTQDAVDPRYAANAEWWVYRTTKTKLRKMKSTTGEFLWQETTRVGEPSTFLGCAINMHRKLDAIPAAGTAKDVALFADARSAYQRRIRKGMFVRRFDDSAYAKRDLTGIMVKMRTGGTVVRPEAARILKVPAA